MIIKSKFNGKCDLCGESFETGEDIWWEPKEPAVHLTCYQDSESNHASPIKPIQEGVTARFKTPQKMLDYEDIVREIQGCSDTWIPALLAIVIEEAIKRGIFQTGGMDPDWKTPLLPEGEVYSKFKTPIGFKSFSEIQGDLAENLE